MTITYKIKRSRKRRKTISLQISDKSEIVIAAPHFTPLEEINRFVQEKQNWINKTIRTQKEEAIRIKEREFITGEKFYYLGASYPLEVIFDPFETEGVSLLNHCFYINTRGNRDLRKYYFVSWYKKKAREYICQRVDFFRSVLKLQSGTITISSAEKRWGSCSPDDNLSFSFRLIMAPPDVIDYVVIHELMHIKEKNHSSKFWALVELAMPEYKNHRRWLQNNHRALML